MWDDCNDLDLSVVEPVSNFKIWYSDTLSKSSHGKIDIDKNAIMCEDYSPVENV